MPMCQEAIGQVRLSEMNLILLDLQTFHLVDRQKEILIVYMSSHKIGTKIRIRMLNDLKLAINWASSHIIFIISSTDLNTLCY
jgi:hypothetical protein